MILDNCSVHHTADADADADADVKQAFNDAGILVIYLPLYSPDLNPIEETFSYVKYYLKDHDEVLQSVKDPKPIIYAALKSITVEMCQRWINHSGCY